MLSRRRSCASAAGLDAADAQGGETTIEAGAEREAIEQRTLNVVADAGYSNGAQAEALEAQGIVPHVPANRAVNNQGDGSLFDRRCFSYDGATDTLRCPAGLTLRRKQLHRKDRMIIYAAEIGDCGTCVLKARCTARPRRLVARHLHEAALQRMHARATLQLVRLRRCVVEHPFASLKYRMFEKPRFLLRGRWGAGTEMSLATRVWNLKRAMAVPGNAALAGRLARAWHQPRVQTRKRERPAERGVLVTLASPSVSTRTAKSPFRLDPKPCPLPPIH